MQQNRVVIAPIVVHYGIFTQQAFNTTKDFELNIHVPQKVVIFPY